MTNSLDLTRDSIFRSSAECYTGMDGPTKGKQSIVDFCQERAGKRILDLGCATGNYCLALERLGFECTGVDINEEYVDIAQKRGVNALSINGSLPFNDKSFDTIIMLEVLEHVENLDELLLEVKRMARTNVLLTVPNNTGYELLLQYNLTYEHMLEVDHINFFTKDSLAALLEQYFAKCSVKEDEPIFVHGLLPWYVRKPISLGIRLGLVKPLVSFRLFAECLVEWP